MRHSYLPPSFLRVLHVAKALILALATVSNVNAQDCHPEGTLGILAVQGMDSASVQLVLDTAATFGADTAWDVACTADSTALGLCLITGGEAWDVSAIPSNGEAPIPFSIALFADSSALTMEFDLTAIAMQSASLSYVLDGDTVSVDLLLTPGVDLPSGAFAGEISVELTPSCAVPGCTDETACNFNPEATEDDGSCTYPYFCFDCEGNCLCDVDEDGICDPLEFPGCTDTLACNWAPVYTEEDGSCFYAQPGFDCTGFCLPVDNDECGFAEPIACSQIVSATTVCADTTESDYCDQYNIGDYYHGGLWYTIMGTGDTLRATMCFEETDYDTYLSVYEGDCDDLNCVGGNDDQDETNFFADACFENFLSSSVDWMSEEGVEYFLHVSGSNAVTPAVGGFDFVLICDGVEVGTCLDSLACNFNPFGTFDDGSCDYATCAGCGLFSACNYDSTAFINNLDLCDFGCYGCTDNQACNFNPDATIESGLCEYNSCAGCLDSEACNYNSEAILDAENCEYTSCVGCTDESASNFNPGATQEDGSCTYCDLLLSLPDVTPESCFAEGDGQAFIDLDSALTDSVYFELTAPGVSANGVWEDGVFGGLIPGNYLLEVFDGDSSCSAVRTFTITAAPDVSLFAVATSPLCAGGDDGAISAFVADTVEVVGFSLNNGVPGADDTFLGLSAGNYVLTAEVVVPSGATCFDTTLISVVDPPGIVVTIDQIEGAEPGEENGGVEITVTGGQEPFSFDWTGPDGNSSQEDPDDLMAGEWTLVVTDADGCSTEVEVSVPVGVEEWSAPRFAIMPNPTRQDYRIEFERLFEGTLELSDLTGRRLNRKTVRGWSTQGSLSGLPEGVYFLRAEDVRGAGTVLRIVKQD
jgi:hypothetical protein